jgi:PKD repeat protein
VLSTATRAKVVRCLQLFLLAVVLPRAAAAANRLPIANAGPDLTGTANVALSFIGSGSYDPDGYVSAYWWQFGDAAHGSVTTSLSSVSYTYTQAGTYTVTLWVRDNSGAWSSTADTAKVVIGTGTGTTSTTSTSSTTSTTLSTTLANQAPRANAGPDQVAQTLTAIMLDGRSSYDPDGSISSYRWNFGDGTTGTGSTTFHTYYACAFYLVTLTVTDNKGAIGQDTAVVVATDRAPTANAGPAAASASTAPARRIRTVRSPRMPGPSATAPARPA